MYLTHLFLQMSSTKDSINNDNSSEGPLLFNLAAAAVALARYKLSVCILVLKSWPAIGPMHCIYIEHHIPL